MKRTLYVFVGNEARLVGTLHYDQNGSREHAAFSYDATWLDAPDRFAVEPNLPLVTGAQFHRKAPAGSVFPAALADTEPDGWGRRVILRDHAKRGQSARRSGNEAGSAQRNAVDFLLAVDDGSRVGALRFRDEAGVFQRASKPERRTAPPLLELRHLLAASRAVETATETAADLAYLRGRALRWVDCAPNVPCSTTTECWPLESSPVCRTNARSRRVKCWRCDSPRQLESRSRRHGSWTATASRWRWYGVSIGRPTAVA